MKIDLLHPSREQLLTKWPEVSKLRDISQWTTEAELAWLAEAAFKKEVGVEVGSYKGKSANAICLGLYGILTCVDRFQDNTEADFKRNAASLLEFGKVSLMSMESGRAAEVWKSHDTPIDFLFIDASHEKHDVLRDLQLWTPLVRDGGLIALHDCFPQDWPNNGIHQALLEFRPDFHLAIDSIACFYK